jgi:ribosomal protein S18 acetylase RimI-like enzyme
MNSSSRSTRIAKGDDSDEVAELLDRFQTEFDEATPGAEVLAPRVREHIARDLSVFLLAAPRHVGVAQLRFREYLFSGAPMCYLEELYVVPEHRREGHGRSLMETALAVARDRGATMVELNTSISDSAARALYESFGFTNLERAGKPETQMLYYERAL